MKQWYTHLVEIESIIIELDKMDLSKEEKLHLAQLVDSSLHHTISNAVFSQLKEEDKRMFVAQLDKNNYNEIWKFLNQRVDGIEEKIKKVAEDLKHELHKDLKIAKKGKIL